MKIALRIMGCRLNHAEGAAIRGALEEAGHEVSVGGDGAGADAFVLHTCAVTAAAQTEALRHLRAARRAGAARIVVCGCAASVADEAALREAGADEIVSRRAPAPPAGSLAAIVADALGRPLAHRPSLFSTRAPVKVQDGCSFRCSYCIVPDARGAPRSRPAAEVLAEARGLLARGFRELVLTGVNVACWREADRSFADLVRDIAALPGLGRMRISSIEPHTAEREIVALMAAPGSRLCPMLHYPLQSGSDRVLRAMRRRYTAAEYRAAVERAVALVPGLGLGADIITGFPGETDADFGETLRLVRDYPFSNLHVFPYSERPGTPAATMPGAVPVRVRRDRAKALIALGEDKRAAFAATFPGREVEALVERVGEDGVAEGWTGPYLRARLPGRAPGDVGAILRARVAGVDGDTLLLR